MTLKFNSIIFNPLSGVATQRDISWSRLRLSFKDTDTDCNPSIELSLLQTANPRHHCRIRKRREGSGKDHPSGSPRFARSERHNISPLMRRRGGTKRDERSMNRSFRIFCDSKATSALPLKEHAQRTSRCPLYPQSGHVQCTSPCPPSANSGHRLKCFMDCRRKSS